MKSISLILAISMIAVTHVAVAAAMPTTQKAARPNSAVGQEGCVRAECHADVRNYAVVHGPVRVNACDACHESVDVEAHTFRLTRAKAELCTYCHESNVNAMPVVHKPVALGECLGCHDPHGGANAYLSRERSVSELCNRCHEPITHGRSVLHTPVAQGACVSCHAPHASRFPKLLDAAGPDLCLACHGDFEARMSKAKFTHKALDKGCQHCHDVHGSNQPMATTQPVREQCAGCHEKVMSVANAAKFKHTPMSDERACMNCHTPHGANSSKLVKNTPAKLCGACHAAGIKTPDGRALAMPDLSGKSGHVHGAMRDGECAGCHASHGGEQASLLTKFYSGFFYQRFSPERYALCFSCHDTGIAQQPKATAKLTAFRNGVQNLHFVHVNLQGERGENCRVCHDSHVGGANDKRVRDRVRYGTWDMPIRYTTTATGGSCYPGCHPRYEYDREQPLPNKLEPRPQPGIARAAREGPARVELRAKDLRGNEVRVPDATRPTVILIVQANQEESRAALATLVTPKNAQVLVVVRGGAGGDAFGQHAVISDSDGAITAQLDVHGWPTALILDKNGIELARVGGTANSLAMKLAAYTDLAAGRTDVSVRAAATLPGVVGDDAVERAVAASHELRLAERLVESARFADARPILVRVLAGDPRSARAHYLLGRVLEGEGNWKAAAQEYRASRELLSVP